MLTTEGIERAIQMFEGGLTDSAVAEGTGISLEETKAGSIRMKSNDTNRGGFLPVARLDLFSAQ